MKKIIQLVVCVVLVFGFRIEQNIFVANASSQGACIMQTSTDAVVFCDTFDAPAGIGNRAGDLDGNVWGVSRAMGGGVNFGQGWYNQWPSTTLRKCDGSTPRVLAPNDVIICNGQLREASNDNVSGTYDAGDVTVLAMYPKQPFDFAGRTGTVSFDVSNDTHGTHAAWPEFWMTDLPIPAPFNHFDSWQSLPKNGFGIRFAASAPVGMFGNCPNLNNSNVKRWTVDSAVVSRNYVMEDVTDNGPAYGVGNMHVTATDCVIQPDDNSGQMNHVELRISQNQIDVYATDAGVAPSAATLKHIAVISNANLTLTRGLIWIEDVHYNADKAESGPGVPSQREHTFIWDNVAFDGPFTYRDFSYDALDALVPSINGSANLGKASQANQSASWSVLNMPANPQATAARVLFNFHTEVQPIPSTLNVTVNGHAHPTAWPYPDTRQNTWRTFAVTVPLSDLVTGTNVVQIGADQSIVTSNVNIVLVDVPGGVPVLPGSVNTYPSGNSPVVNLSANPTSITSGSSSTITWTSSNVTSCTGSGAWSGTKAISGSQSVSPTVSSTYTLACTGTGGTATQSVTVTVSSGDAISPTVSITSPASGSGVSGSSVVISASASDNIGVAGVQFKLDGTNLGTEDTTSPYTITWDSTAVSNGTHTLTAVARDTSNNTGTSSAISVSVNNVATPGPSASIAGLHVSGNQILNSSNQAVHLRGVNVAGASYMCQSAGSNLDFDGPTDQASINALKTWQINAVRIPISEDCWLGINGQPSNGHSVAQYQTAVTNYINLLTSNGIAVIFDLQFSAPGTTIAQNTEPMPDADHSSAFWSSVANTYKTNSSVIFDLFNEPWPDNNSISTAAWTCLRDGGTCPGVSYATVGMQGLVNTVRTAGATNILMIPGITFANTLDQWLAFKPTDPQNNLAASWHTYNNQYCSAQSCWDSQIAPVMASVPLIAGEIGEGDCAHTFIDPLMTWLDNHNGNYLGWSWATYDCASFPSLISNYNGTPTAFGIGYRDHLLALAGGTPAPTVSISANPTTITSGNASTLTWSSTNATSCTASGGWSGTKATSGTQSISPTVTTTYVLTCSGTGGSGSNSTIVTVGAVVPPSGSWVNVTGNIAGLASECGNLTMLSTVPNSNSVLAGVALSGLWSNSNGSTWNHLGTGSGSAPMNNRPSWITYDPNNPLIFWESGIYGTNGGVYKTINGGNTFTQLGSVFHIDYVSVDFSDPNRMTLLAGRHETAQSVWKSTDGGNSWTNIGANLPAGTGFNTSPIIINSQTYLVNADPSFSGGTPGIFRTTNGGATWTKVSSFGPNNNPPLMASNGTIYWSTNNSLVKSTDLGLTWTQVGSGLQNVRPIELPDGRIVSVGSNSLVVSSDGGSTWSSIGAALPYGASNQMSVVYSNTRQAFFISHWDCGNAVLPDAVEQLSYTIGGNASANQVPVGTFDGLKADGVTLRGWSYDPDISSGSNAIQIFVNGVAGTGSLIYSATTNVFRSDVNSNFGITGTHGFEFAIPSQYQDGAAHSYYVYGIDLNDSSKSTLLAGSPKSVTVTAATTPSPTPTPTPSPTPTPTPTPSPSPTPSPTPPPAPPVGYTVDASKYPSGIFVKYAGDPTVYIINGGTKYPITDWSVYQNRVPSSRSIITIPGSVTFPTGSIIGLRSGTLVKSVNSSTIYLFDGTNRLAFTNQSDFLSLGYKFGQVYSINDDKLFNGYPVINIQKSLFVRPQGTLFKYQNNPTIYYLDNGMKRAFTSMFMYKAWYDRLDQVVTIGSSEMYPDGTNILLPNGIVVNTQADPSTYYIIAGGIVRPLNNNFMMSLGFQTTQVLTVSQDDLNRHGGIGPEWK